MAQTAGKNVSMEVKGNILTISVDISKTFGKSGTGKSVIIGTTAGNVPLNNREDIKIGLNVYSTNLSLG